MNCTKKTTIYLLVIVILGDATKSMGRKTGKGYTVKVACNKSKEERTKSPLCTDLLPAP